MAICRFYSHPATRRGQRRRTAVCTQYLCCTRTSLYILYCLWYIIGIQAITIAVQVYNIYIARRCRFLESRKTNWEIQLLVCFIASCSESSAMSICHSVTHAIYTIYTTYIIHRYKYIPHGAASIFSSSNIGLYPSIYYSKLPCATSQSSQHII